MAALVDLTGQSFGRWTVIGRAPSSGTGKESTRARWFCRCECGGEGDVSGRDLRAGKSQSCGCLKLQQLKARLTKHGHNDKRKKSRTYCSWISMKTRCRNPNSHAYSRYGGRGVTYCPQWEDFDVFLRDMGERPQDTSLDRIDPYGNYEPGNCRWATAKVQNTNTRKHRARDRELA